jgi:hypothetical protein
MEKLSNYQSFIQYRKMASINESVIDDKFIRKAMEGYLEAALWTEEERIKGEDGEDIDFNIHNFTEDAEIDTYLHIKKFLNGLSDKVKSFIDEGGILPEQLGHDLWLTQNGHGAGFFDRGYEDDIEENLTSVAKKHPEVVLELGDDGRFSFLGHGNL